MYHNIAGRAPLLDRRVVEFAASLPATWKRTGRTLKWFLRQVATDRIPADLVSAAQSGPSCATTCMASRRSRDQGGSGSRLDHLRSAWNIQPSGVSPRGRRPPTRSRDYGYVIWTMAMVELWYRTFIDQLDKPTSAIWE